MYDKLIGAVREFNDVAGDPPCRVVTFHPSKFGEVRAELEKRGVRFISDEQGERLELVTSRGIVEVKADPECPIGEARAFA